MTQEQETALQIVRTSNRIATPEQLAIVMKTEPRYFTIPHSARLDWIGQQIITLHYMSHSQKLPSDFDLLIESSLLDQAIMDDEGLRGLTQVEMQEAFRRGITREYGDFYGITSASMVGFLKAFRVCDKRMKAIALLYDAEQKKLKTEDALFWKTLAEAKERGDIEIPDFSFSPFEDDKQKAERFAKMREEIIKMQGNTKQE
jgi:hypothetical protein